MNTDPDFGKNIIIFIDILARFGLNIFF